MRAMGRLLVLFVLSVTLVACDGSSSGKSGDTTAPVITLTGANPQVIEAGTAYVELGATASDNRDGDLSSAIVIDTSQVDTQMPGSYAVTYTVTDAAGNSGTATRTVVIEDTTPPVITLLGDDPQVIVAGNPYIELGATASDTLDGDLSAQIVIDATAVDTMVAGDYTVTYDVTDAAGNAAVTVTRTVRVELPPPPAAPQVSVAGDIKQLIFSWDDVANADYYRLMENPDGHSGFTQVGGNIPSAEISIARDIAVHLHDWVNALYMVQACNLGGCADSTQISAADVMLDTIGYFKASNTEAADAFGYGLTVSLDGNTLAVVAPGEDSNATGINGDQTDNSADDPGAVYVFRSSGSSWVQQAYIKASNIEPGDGFGSSLALSADGNTLVVGAPRERSSAIGINGDEADNSMWRAGAVYVFRFDGSDWYQEAYVKSLLTWEGQEFGRSVAVSADGNTFAAGAPAPNYFGAFGRTFVFEFDGSVWRQQAVIRDEYRDSEFGWQVAMDRTGTLLAISAPIDSAIDVYRLDGGGWIHHSVIVPTRPPGMVIEWFGNQLALSANGTTIAAFSAYTYDPQTGEYLCQAHIFRLDGTAWKEQETIRPVADRCHVKLALAEHGNLLAIGRSSDDSSATGINGDQTDMSAPGAGAVHLFAFDNSAWGPTAYLKAPNTDAGDRFGSSVAFADNGSTLAVGASGEDSNAYGINGDQADNSAENAGAVYVY